MRANSYYHRIELLADGSTYAETWVKVLEVTEDYVSCIFINRNEGSLYTFEQHFRMLKNEANHNAWREVVPRVFDKALIELISSLTELSNQINL